MERSREDAEAIKDEALSFAVVAIAGYFSCNRVGGSKVVNAMTNMPYFRTF